MKRSILHKEVIFDKCGHFSAQYAMFFIRDSSYIMVNRFIKTCIFYSNLRVIFSAKPRRKLLCTERVRGGCYLKKYCRHYLWPCPTFYISCLRAFRPLFVDIFLFCWNTKFRFIDWLQNLFL